MRYFFGDNKIMAEITIPYRESTRKMDLSILCRLPIHQVKVILEITRKCVGRKEFRTQQTYLLICVIGYGKFLAAKGYTSLPQNAEDWQQSVCEWFAWHLSNNLSKATLPTRINMWENISCWLRFMQDEGLISRSVHFPGTRLKKEAFVPGANTKPNFMGEPRTEKSGSKAPLNKSLAGEILWESESNYLDHIENTLRERNNLLRKVLDDYWLKLVKDYRSGKNIQRKVSEFEFAERCSKNYWHIGRKINGKNRLGPKVAFPSAENCEAWTLRIIRDQLESACSDRSFSIPSIKKHPAFHTRFGRRDQGTPLSELMRRSALTSDQLNLLSRMQIIARFLGLLNPIDMAVAICILIQEHPNLNPLSIVHAKLYNDSDKLHLISTDRYGNFIFSVDKPRANARKYIVLSPRAKQVMKHILRVTEIPRNILKRANMKHWRYLFLGYAGRPATKIGHCDVTAKQLTGVDQQSLLRYYPELQEGGLNLDTLNFAKIRVAQGIMEWYRTGSVLEVSKVLGNTHRTAITHYVPAPLVRLFNERLIRRFQNVLIVIAHPDENSLLKISDFRNLNELHQFLASALHEFSLGSSPIGNELHARHNKEENVHLTHEIVMKKREGILTLRLNTNVLTALYTFRDQYQRTNGTLLSDNEISADICPRKLVELANLLTAAATTDSVGESLHETLEIGKLKRLHKEAQEISVKLAKENGIKNIRDFQG